MALGEGEALRQLGQLANDTKEIWRLSFEVLGARINSLDSLIRALASRGPLSLESQRRARLIRDKLTHKLVQRRKFVNYVKSQVRNKLSFLEEYEFVRHLGTTILEGEVNIHRHRRTGNLVAVKTSPLYGMANSKHEFPLHEVYIYRLFQEGKRGHRIPPPSWFLHLEARQRQRIGVALVGAWRRPPAERDGEYKRLCGRFVDDLRITETQAMQLVRYFVLLFECQSYFRFCPEPQTQASKHISRPLQGGGHRHIATNHYMVLELCRGGDFFAFLKSQKEQNEDVCGKFFGQLVSAVAFMHSCGVCHLDLSLEQMLISIPESDLELKDGSLKLIDFGQTRYFPKRPRSGDTKETHGKFPGTFAGKDGYRAPEIWRRERYDGAKADVFSLGVILSLMVLGFPLFPSSLHLRYTYVIQGRTGDILRHFGRHEQAEALEKSGALDLIQRMLMPESQRLSLNELLSHRWFQRFVPKRLRDHIKFYLNADEDPGDNKGKKKSQTASSIGPSDEAKGSMDIVEDPNSLDISKGGPNSSSSSGEREGGSKVLTYVEAKDDWEIFPPIWLRKQDKATANKALQECEAVWLADDNPEARFKRVDILIELLCRRFQINPSEARDLLWFTFLRLKLRELRRKDSGGTDSKSRK